MILMVVRACFKIWKTYQVNWKALEENMIINCDENKDYLDRKTL